MTTSTLPPDANDDAERRRLQLIAEDSWYGVGANAHGMDYGSRIFLRHVVGSSCLELGPAEGIMTDRLARRFSDLTVVDGASHFCESLRRRLPAVNVIEGLFEEFEPHRTFDTIVLGHVLEHVVDPIEILRRVSTWLSPAGRVLAAVPNARSLHRQMGVVMGLLLTESDMNEADVHHGHRRVYSPEELRRDVRLGGLRLLHYGGYWVKLNSNAQIDRDWSSEALEAAMVIGERYPDIACEIYVVADRP